MDDRQRRSPVRVRAGRVCTLRTPSVPAPFYVALVGVTGVTVPAVTTFVRSSLPALIADAGELLAATLFAHEPEAFREHGSAGLYDHGGPLAASMSTISPG